MTQKKQTSRTTVFFNLRNLEWTKQAKCVGMDPELFDITVTHHLTDAVTKQAIAEDLCAGCPVMPECAADALETRSFEIVRAATHCPPQGQGRKESIARLARIARGETVD